MSQPDHDSHVSPYNLPRDETRRDFRRATGEGDQDGREIAASWFWYWSRLWHRARRAAGLERDPRTRRR